MREDYQLDGPTKKIEVELEEEVAKILDRMTSFTKLTHSQITNTALKRFIAAHKDFMGKDEID